MECARIAAVILSAARYVRSRRCKTIQHRRCGSFRAVQTSPRVWQCVSGVSICYAVLTTACTQELRQMYRDACVSMKTENWAPNIYGAAARSRWCFNRWSVTAVERRAWNTISNGYPNEKRKRSCARRICFDRIFRHWQLPEKFTHQ